METQVGKANVSPEANNWIPSILIALMMLIFVAIPFASGGTRLAYYRQKDAAIQWLGEEFYLFSRYGSKGEVRIVCLGDSMTDDQPILNRLLVLRPNWVEMLRTRLRERFPELRIRVYNHGVRSEGISSTSARMLNPSERLDNYHKKQTVLPAVVTINPDIIILESHGYMSHPMDRDEYVKTVKETVFLAQEQMEAEVFFLATICPDGANLKKPYPKYANDPEKRTREAKLIRKRIEDFMQLGEELGIEVIDVYSKSSANPKEYVKSKDMVHPSYEGHLLIAEEVFNEIKDSTRLAARNTTSEMAGNFAQGKGQ